jgi:hypothetical protein
VQIPGYRPAQTQGHSVGGANLRLPSQAFSSSDRLPRKALASPITSSATSVTSWFEVPPCAVTRAEEPVGSDGTAKGQYAEDVPGHEVILFDR